jgi:facilitated trehalose transporter
MTAKQTLAELTNPATLKPIGILFTYFLFCLFSGGSAITSYAVTIFQESGTSLDKHTCTIMLGVVRLVFTIAGSIALRKFGRRTLTFISSEFKKVGRGQELKFG